MKTLLRITVSLLTLTSTWADLIPTVEVNPMLEEIRSEHELPALGGIAIVDGEVKAIRSHHRR